MVIELNSVECLVLRDFMMQGVVSVMGMVYRYSSTGYPWWVSVSVSHSRPD